MLPGCAPIAAGHAPEVVAAVRSAHAAGARVAATCTGVSLALAAGLLGGRSATTHWRQEESLTSAHPDVALTPQALYVDHGDVVTGAGTSASLDLYLIARDHGSDVAEHVGRHLLAPRRSEGQHHAPAGTAHDAAADRSDPLAAVLEHLAAHAHQREPVAAAAARSGRSERTLRRQLRRELGTTPSAHRTASRSTRPDPDRGGPSRDRAPSQGEPG